MIWKEIPGYNGRYLISDEGVIYSNILHRNLKIFKHTRGYLRVSLYIPKIGEKQQFIHRLLAKTFLGDIDGKVVMHLNDKTDDNRLGNLCIATQQDNMNDKLSKGRSNIPRIYKFGFERMKEIIIEKGSIASKCRKYGIHRNTILYWKKNVFNNNIL